MVTSAVATLLDRLPPPPQRALMPGAAASPASPAVAEAFLSGLGACDRSIHVLALGLGLDLGSVAFVLQLDPSIVAWRLRRTLCGGPPGIDPASLEAGVTRWLRSTPADAAGTDATRGHPATVAERSFAELPDDTRERLAARLDSHDQDDVATSRRPGLGIGSFVLIIVAAAGFMVYGAVRDVNPLWRGMALVRAADYPAARNAFQELGSLPEGRAWTAMSWLAEGDFDHAFAILADRAVASFLGEFRPLDTPLPTVDGNPESPALLPRGLCTESRPSFVYVADGAKWLTIELLPEDTGPSRKLRWQLPGDGTATGVTVLEYPEGWPGLTGGVVLWDVRELKDAPDGEVEQASFTVLSRLARREITQHAAVRLTHEIPFAAREYLRAQYDMRNGLLVDAAERIATLAKTFPDAAYPRQMLGRIAAALGVDQAALVR